MPIQHIIAFYLFVRRISVYFLQDIMQEVESHTEKIKIRFVLQLCILFFVFTSFISFTVYLISPYAFLAMILFWCINISTPFIIKHTKSVYRPAKVFLFAAFICCIHVHMVVGNPEGLGPVLWYLIVILSASFVLGKRWGLFYVVMTIGIIALLNMTRYLGIELYGINEQQGVGKLLMMPLRIGAPLLFLYIIVRRFIEGKELAEKKSEKLFSQQKKLNKTIAERELAYRNLVEEVEDMIYELDAEGKFTFVNKAGSKALGYSKKELLNKSIYELVIPKEQNAIRQYYRTQEQKGIHSTYHQLQVTTQSGEVIWIDQRMKMRFDEKGKLIKSFCVGRNISEQKEIDSMLEKAKNEAIQQHKMKTNFMSSMSHELKTPLNAVVALGHDLLDGNLKPEHKKNIETILFSANNLVGIVNDLLDYNLIEAGRVKLKYRPFDLKDAVEKTVFLNQQILQNKPINIELTLSDNIPSTLIGDAGRLVQVINNLLQNAIKFTHEGTVELSVQTLELTKKSTTLYFEVKDTGIGIERAKLDRIFDQFTQIDRSLSREYGGTGLGLSIVKKLLHQMDSAIEVKSQLNVGSSFFFTISLARPLTESTVSPPQRKRSNNGLEGLRVLLVEDNKINQLVTKKILLKWKMKVDIAENGQIGVDKFKENEYDLILMDLEMPILNGFDATKQIRNLEASPSTIPIIAVTASAVTDIVSQLATYQFTDLVMKPFEPNELYDKMLEYCSGYTVFCDSELSGTITRLDTDDVPK